MTFLGWLPIAVVKGKYTGASGVVQKTTDKGAHLSLQLAVWLAADSFEDQDDDQHSRATGAGGGMPRVVGRVWLGRPGCPHLGARIEPRPHRCPRTVPSRPCSRDSKVS